MNPISREGLQPFAEPLDPFLLRSLQHCGDKLVIHIQHPRKMLEFVSLRSGDLAVLKSFVRQGEEEGAIRRSDVIWRQWFDSRLTSGNKQAGAALPRPGISPKCK